MSKRSQLKLPREHGAWVILYVALAAGALVAWSAPLRLLFLVPSVTFMFIARESLLSWWRAHSRGKQDRKSLQFALAYLGLAGLFAAPLLLVYHLYWFVTMGFAALTLLAINTRQAVRREDKTIGGEIMAIAGLTLAAPATYYATRGTFNVTAVWLWVFCAAYFSSSVFYVKLRVNTINPRIEEIGRQSLRRCTLYHAMLLAALMVIALTQSLNLLACAAFAPVLARSFWHVARPVRQINLRRIGWIEAAYSLVFLLFTTLTFRA